MSYKTLPSLEILTPHTMIRKNHPLKYFFNQNGYFTVIVERKFYFNFNVSSVE